MKKVIMVKVRAVVEVEVEVELTAVSCEMIKAREMKLQALKVVVVEGLHVGWVKGMLLLTRLVVKAIIKHY